MNENSGLIIDLVAARSEQRRRKRRVELARARSAGGILWSSFPVFGLYCTTEPGVGVYRAGARYAYSPPFQPGRRIG
jgi:hypothetical protein